MVLVICSSKLQFQGYYFRTNNVANMTLAGQNNNNKLLKSSE